jgi:hypothetical protein
MLEKNKGLDLSALFSQNLTNPCLSLPIHQNYAKESSISLEAALK